jgi:Phage minor capsid protein 2
MNSTEKLIQLYTEANLQLLALIQTLEEGPTKRKKEQLQKQVQNILNQLTETAAEGARQIIEDSYGDGSAAAIRELKRQGLLASQLEATMKTVLHTRAVQAIVDETFYRILEASDHMAQDAKDRIESIVRTANQRSLVEGVSRRQATKDAIAEVNQVGIRGMVAKNGAVIPAEKYMANVIQYHQRQAHVEGVLNRMTDNNSDLVYVNTVGITCQLCAQYQGRVYSLTGKDSRFPKLTVRPPYHGHCVHSTSPWVEEYHDDLEIRRMLKDSNRPFEDNRSEQNIKRYQELQKEKSQKNDTYKQWIRYKARMPDLPDLRQFASQKARDTNTFKQWQEDYRKVGAKIKDRGG